MMPNKFSPFIFILLIALGPIFFSCEKSEKAQSEARKTELAPLENKLLLNEKTINIKIKNFCYDEKFKRSDFFVRNLNTKVEKGVLLPDTDGDGIPNDRDDLELLNILPTLSDTNSDGYGDLLVYRLGYTTDEQNHLANCLSPGDDRDYDGLNDCEEKSIRTDYLNFDTDKDGIPDSIELRMGLDPINGPGEADLDLDGDGLTNIEEMRANTPFDESNKGYINLFAIKYDSSKTEDVQSNCFDYTISNIPITESVNTNIINLYVIEQELSTFKKFMTVYSFLIPSSVEDKLTYEWSKDEIEPFFIGRSP